MWLGGECLPNRGETLVPSPVLQRRVKMIISCYKPVTTQKIKQTVKGARFQHGNRASQPQSALSSRRPRSACRARQDGGVLVPGWTEAEPVLCCSSLAAVAKVSCSHFSGLNIAWEQTQAAASKKEDSGCHGGVSDGDGRQGRDQPGRSHGGPSIWDAASETSACLCPGPRYTQGSGCVSCCPAQ